MEQTRLIQGFYCPIIKNTGMVTSELPNKIGILENRCLVHFQGLDYQEKQSLPLIRPEQSNTLFTTAAVQIWEERLLKRLDSTDFKKYFINQTVFRSSSKTDHSLNSYQSFQNIATCYYTKNTADFDNSIHHWSGFIKPYLTKYQSISFTSKSKTEEQTWHKNPSYEVKIYLNQNDSSQEIGHCSLIHLPHSLYFVDAGFGLQRMYNALNWSNFTASLADSQIVLREDANANFKLIEHLLAEGIENAPKDKIYIFRKIIVNFIRLFRGSYDVLFNFMNVYDYGSDKLKIQRLVMRQILFDLITGNNELSNMKIRPTKNSEALPVKEFFDKFNQHRSIFQRLLSKHNITPETLITLCPQKEL